LLVFTGLRRDSGATFAAIAAPEFSRGFQPTERVITRRGVASATPAVAVVIFHDIHFSGVADATRLDLLVPPWVETHG